MVIWELGLGKWGGGALSSATATPDPSCVCDLHHSSQRRWILDPTEQGQGWNHNLMAPSKIRFRCATTGTPTFTLKVYLEGANLDVCV